MFCGYSGLTHNGGGMHRTTPSSFMSHEPLVLYRTGGFLRRQVTDSYERILMIWICGIFGGTLAITSPFSTWHNLIIIDMVVLRLGLCTVCMLVVQGRVITGS